MAETATAVDRDEWWADLIGQPRAMAALRAAVVEPVHSYLLVGKQGWGTRPAALAFGAALLASDAAGMGLDVDRAATLALAEQHPDLHVFEPEGAAITADEARSIVALAARTPVEGGRKVIVVTDLHKMTPNVAPILLKTIEEPSASTIFVILADEILQEQITIASRSVKVEFGPTPIDAIIDALLTDGVVMDDARRVAEAAAGDLRRARLLTTDASLAVRHDSWASVPVRLDGTGHMATMLVDEVLGHIDVAQEPLRKRHATEIDELAERIEEYGLKGSAKKQLDTVHKREERAHTRDELLFGFATIAATYRERLADARDPESLLDGLDRLTAAAEALERNPTEKLLLQALFANLPPLH